MTNFPENLKHLRKSSGKTQKELGQILGVGQTTIANYEQGARFPDSETLLHIADLYGVSLDFLLGRSSEELAHEDPRGSSSLAENHPNIEDSTRHLVDFVLSGRGDMAARLVHGLADRGYDIRDIYGRVLAPVLHRVGSLWENGELDVYAEHYASQMIRELMFSMKSRMNRRLPHGKRFLGMTAGGELHELGLQMASDFLYMDGWDCYFLGSYLPSQEALKAIVQFRPQLVGVSVTMDLHLDSAAGLVAHLRSRLPADTLPKFICGGAAFAKDPSAWRSIGADGYARDAEEAVRLANQLVPHPPA